MALSASDAWAGQSTTHSPGNGNATAQNSGGNVTVGVSKAQTSGDKKQGGAKPSGELTSSDSNWTPPACWYEPTYSPKEMEAMVGKWRTFKFFGIGDMIGDIYDSQYKTGDPAKGGYKDYNLDQEGKGMFWSAVRNPNRLDDPASSKCDKFPFWVENGKTPDVPMAINAKILGEYASDSIALPSTQVSMAPSGTSTVNLPTWIWAPGNKFTEKKVTASLAGISSTATARPVALHIEAGTPDATVFPASGDCPINADGSIGEPYAAGKAGQTPPCGVTYERAGSYSFKASITWKVSWSATNGESGGLPDSIFTTPPQNVTVQEIQSINR
uniref:Secreted protein n=1 Tax=Streptomyces sp. NBC_00003 TaxID=2903608 RepID=A0AAU2V4R9_9ACTN